MTFSITISVLNHARSQVALLTESNIVEYNYGLAANSIHDLTFTLSPCSQAYLIQEFFTVEVFYTYPGCGTPTHEGQTTFIIVRRRAVRSSSVALEYEYYCQSIDRMLAFRSIPWHSGSPEANKELPAETLMKKIFEEQFFDPKARRPLELYAPNVEEIVKLGRDTTGLLFTGFDDQQGFVIKKSFSWQTSLLYLFQQIAAQNTEMGEPLFFNLVSTSSQAGLTAPAPHQFQTFFYNRGVDRKDVVLSVDRNTLSNAVYEIDSSESVTAAWSPGKGEEDNRQVGFYANHDAFSSSPYNWLEAIQDSRNHDDDQLSEEAARRVNSSGTRISVTADLSPEHYNRTYFWGDRVRYAVDDMNGGKKTGVAVITAVNVSKVNRSGRESSRIIARIQDLLVVSNGFSEQPASPDGLGDYIPIKRREDQ